MSEETQKHEPMLAPAQHQTQHEAPSLVVNSQGWIDQIPQKKSPFFNERPEGTDVDLVVIHFISLPPGKFEGDDVQALFMGTLDTSKDPFYEELKGLEVSAHFFIRRDGSVTQFVSTLDRAWHAGMSFFEGRVNCNDFSIGIELEGSESTEFTPEQYASLVPLIRALKEKHPIEAVTGHEVIAPGRKIDPGPYFDWLLMQEALGDEVRIVERRQIINVG